MKHNKKILILAILITANLNLLAQEKKAKKNLRILPFPALSFSPETKWLFGAGAAAAFKIHPKDSMERTSIINAGAAYTQNKQLLLFAQYNLFLKNKYYLFGEIGYFDFSFFYYGSKGVEVPRELYSVAYPKLKFNIVKRINKEWSIGGGLFYENFNIKKTEPGGALQTQNIFGATGNKIRGLGAVAILDTRDSIFYPRKGMFGNFSLFTHNKVLGGNVNYQRLVADLAYYKSLSKKTILALQSYNSFIVGKAPFQELSILGGSKLMRGYYLGRFGDDNLTMLQSEARFPLYKRWAGAVFASGAFLGNKEQFLRTNDFKYSYGGGIRFTFNRKDHLNVRLDYALGKDVRNFYFTIGEAF
jgi:outer membrane protein assembly factor BamA